mgnify:CR=1 FL=1
MSPSASSSMSVHAAMVRAAATFSSIPMMPRSGWPRRLSLTPLPGMNAAPYPSFFNSLVLKPS